MSVKVTMVGGKSVIVDIDLKMDRDKSPWSDDELRFSGGHYDTIVTGGYEGLECGVTTNYLPKNMDVIELGGGAGIVSCIIGKIINPDRKHVVVEPNPYNIPIIEKHKILNNCNFKIENKMYNAGVNKEEIYELYSPIDNLVGFNKPKMLAVNSISLSDIMSKYDIKDFVLVSDIEGYEANLINDESDILVNYCPLIIIEFHTSRHVFYKNKDDVCPNVKEAYDKLKTLYTELEIRHMNSFQWVGVYSRKNRSG